MGNKNMGKDGNTRIAPLGATPGSPLLTFRLESARLGSARRIRSTQVSASWAPVTPPAAAAAAAAAACYLCCGCPPPPLPPPLAATASVSGSSRARHRLRRCGRLRPPSLLPLPSAAAAAGGGRTSRGGTIVAGSNPCPSLSAALAAAAGRACHFQRCRRRLQPLSFAAVAVGCSLCLHRPLSPPTPSALPGGAPLSPTASLPIVISRFGSRRQTRPPLPPLSTSTVSDHRCRCRPLLSSPPAALTLANARRRRPLPSPPLSAAPAITTGRCRR